MADGGGAQLDAALDMGGAGVEQGDHDELLRHEGPYARLHNAQFTGAAVEIN